MLLSAILKCTDPLHEDYEALGKAEEFVKEATTILNEGKKQYDKVLCISVLSFVLNLRTNIF